MVGLRGQQALTSAVGSWGEYLQELLTEEGRGGRAQTAVAEISVLMDTGFQASSLAFAGADVVAGGPQMFAAVIQVLEASEGLGQDPPLELGRLQGRELRWAELPEVGEIGNSDGWVTKEWRAGLMA